MKKRTKVLFTLVFAITLIFALLVPTFAASSEPIEASPDDSYKYVEWTLSDDGEVLTGDKTYYKTNVHPGYYFDIYSLYHYQNTVESKNGKLSLVTNYEDRNVIIASNRIGNEYVYVTEEVKLSLDEFYKVDKVKQEASLFLYTENNYLFYKDSEMLGRLDSLATTPVEKDVFDLYDYNKTYIKAYDDTRCFYTTVGCVFSMGEEKLYVDYTKLPNNCFDSDGNLSYRQGTVSVMPLDDASAAALQGVKTTPNIYEFEYSYYYESNEVGINLDNVISGAEAAIIVIIGIVIFYAVLIVIGLVLPIIPLVLGLLLPHSKKLGKPRGWYALALSGIAWIIAAVILIVLITVFFIIAVVSM